MDAVPIFEAKNKLPFYIHQAEESGPVFISPPYRKPAACRWKTGWSKKNGLPAMEEAVGSCL